MASDSAPANEYFENLVLNKLLCHFVQNFMVPRLLSGFLGSLDGSYHDR